MIPKTALMHPSYLERVKAAVLRAVVKAHKPGARDGIGHGDVYNRRGRASLEIVARKRGGFEIFDSNDNDVTAEVLAALRVHHSVKGV